MSKGLKIMSLEVINHGMSLSVQTNFEKNDVYSSVEYSGSNVGRNLL
jgi:hypothetical protein